MQSKNSSNLASKIILAYDLKPKQLLAEAKGYRNHIFPAVLEDGRAVSVIVFKNEPGILQTVQRSDRISDYLASKGFLVRQRLDPRTIAIQSHAGSVRYAALYSYLPGSTIPWEAYTKAHIKALGKTMSDMHHALKKYSPHDLPDVEEEYLGIISRMRKYFSDAGVQKAMTAKLGLSLRPESLLVYEELLYKCRSLQGRQALHMDFVRGNILFGKVVDHTGLAIIDGILDFEKAACGYPLFDISRTLAFLLADCKFKTQAQVRKYFLYSGYSKRGQAKLPTNTVILNGRKMPLLEILTTMFLAYDFYKFLRHNPYESLTQNEHYLRTLLLLQERGLVQTTTP